jgi:hypothetical protein
MWRIISLLFIATIITSETAVADETIGDIHYVVARKAVVLNLATTSLSLTETIDCEIVNLEKTDYKTDEKYLAIVGSYPLQAVTQDKEKPFFDALPSISVTGGGMAELRQYTSNPLKPGGAYVIYVTFSKGSVPERFQVIITCQKDITEDTPMELVYKSDKYPIRMALLGHPIDWGPFELRVNCDRLYLISLKKGSGWVESTLGRASLDLESNNSIEFGITPRSKDDPIAQGVRAQDAATAGKQ